MHFLFEVSTNYIMQTLKKQYRKGVMSNSLTVTVQEAIRICENLIPVVDAHISTEAEATKKYYADLRSEEALENAARISLQSLVEWWEILQESFSFETMPTFFAHAKSTLDEIKSYCMVAQEGEFTFDEHSLDIISKCSDDSFISAYVEMLSNYKPSVSNYHRNLLEEKLKEKHQTTKLIPSELICTEKDEPTDTFLLFVVGVVLVAVLFIFI